MPGAAIWSDCLFVVRRSKNGRKAATNSSVKLARLWGIIFDLCEDLTPGQSSWSGCLSTTAAQIGRVRKGNGARTTEIDRKRNNEADQLAKRGAKSHRVQKAACKSAEIITRVAHRAALQLGITTHAADNHRVAETFLVWPRGLQNRSRQ